MPSIPPAMQVHTSAIPASFILSHAPKAAASFASPAPPPAKINKTTNGNDINAAEPNALNNPSVLFCHPAHINPPRNSAPQSRLGIRRVFTSITAATSEAPITTPHRIAISASSVITYAEPVMFTGCPRPKFYTAGEEAFDSSFSNASNVLRISS